MLALSTRPPVQESINLPTTRLPALMGTTSALLGFASAAVSTYWLAGGTALLDTVGGNLETWGRSGATSVVIVLAAVVIAKAGLAFIAIGVVFPIRIGWIPRRLVRGAGWFGGTILTAYGGLLTTVGLLIQAGIITASADADHRALAWHTYLWDPWFFFWGATLLLCLWMTRRTSVGHPGDAATFTVADDAKPTTPEMVREANEGA